MPAQGCLVYSTLLFSFELLRNDFLVVRPKQVIYGDTDSIMINSGLDDIEKAKAIAKTVIEEVRFEI